MKLTKKKIYAGFLLIILALQIISLSVSGLAISNSNPSIENPEPSIKPEKIGESHSSPFHLSKQTCHLYLIGTDHRSRRKTGKNLPFPGKGYLRR